MEEICWLFLGEELSVIFNLGLLYRNENNFVFQKTNIDRYTQNIYAGKFEGFFLPRPLFISPYSTEVFQGMQNKKRYNEKVFSRPVKFF